MSLTGIFYEPMDVRTLHQELWLSAGISVQFLLIPRTLFSLSYSYNREAVTSFVTFLSMLLVHHLVVLEYIIYQC